MKVEYPCISRAQVKIARLPRLSRHCGVSLVNPGEVSCQPSRRKCAPGMNRIRSTCHHGRADHGQARAGGRRQARGYPLGPTAGCQGHETRPPNSWTTRTHPGETESG
jgi:hypothetical protein